MLRCQSRVVVYPSQSTRVRIVTGFSLRPFGPRLSTCNNPDTCRYCTWTVSWIRFAHPTHSPVQCGFHLWCKLYMFGIAALTQSMYNSFHKWKFSTRFGFRYAHPESCTEYPYHCVFRMLWMCSSKPFGLLRPTSTTFFHTMMFLDPSQASLEAQTFYGLGSLRGPELKHGPRREPRPKGLSLIGRPGEESSHMSDFVGHVAAPAQGRGS